MKKSKMTATKLRGLLVTLVIILALLVGVGFYFTQMQLKRFAIDVSHTIADSKATAENVQSLQKVQEELSDQQGAQAKASAIASTRDGYQTQVINDIDTYANLTGVEIQNYAFAAPATTATTAATTPAASASALSSAFQTVTVSLVSPVSYTRLLKFITAIEHNLPKMQIATINLSRSPTAGASSDMVTTDTLTIAVYTQ